MAAFIRQLVEPTLTRPFGEVSMAGMLQTVQLQLATAQGLEAHRRILAGHRPPPALPAAGPPDGRRVRRALLGLRPGDLPAVASS